MKKVVIIDGIESNKLSPWEHPSVLAKRAEVRAEINKYVVKPVVYEHRNTSVEIKAAKEAYKKLSKESKDTFLNELLQRAISNLPNWNFKVSQCK